LANAFDNYIAESRAAKKPAKKIRPKREPERKPARTPKIVKPQARQQPAKLDGMTFGLPMPSLVRMPAPKPQAPLHDAVRKPFPKAKPIQQEKAKPKTAPKKAPVVAKRTPVQAGKDAVVASNPVVQGFLNTISALKNAPETIVNLPSNIASLPGTLERQAKGLWETTVQPAMEHMGAAQILGSPGASPAAFAMAHGRPDVMASAQGTFTDPVKTAASGRVVANTLPLMALGAASKPVQLAAGTAFGVPSAINLNKRRTGELPGFWEDPAMTAMDVAGVGLAPFAARGFMNSMRGLRTPAFPVERVFEPPVPVTEGIRGSLPTRRGAPVVREPARAGTFVRQTTGTLPEKGAPLRRRATEKAPAEPAQVKPPLNKAQEPPVVQGSLEQAPPVEPVKPRIASDIASDAMQTQLEAPAPVEPTVPTKAQVKPSNRKVGGSVKAGLQEPAAPTAPLPKKGKPVEAPVAEKQPWEMTREEYQTFIADLNSRPRALRVVMPDGTIKDTTFEEALANRWITKKFFDKNRWGGLTQKQNSRQTALVSADTHEFRVKRAIANGKIQSHPDYPDLAPAVQPTAPKPAPLVDPTMSTAARIKAWVEENAPRLQATKPVQKVNGYHIVKDGGDYVLVDPYTKNIYEVERYRGKLSRVREVAKEGETLTPPEPSMPKKGAPVRRRATEKAPAEPEVPMQRGEAGFQRFKTEGRTGRELPTKARPVKAQEPVPPVEVPEPLLYHGGPEITGDALVPGGRQGQDMGGIFFTDNLDYAKQYAKPHVYEAKASDVASNIFDPRKPEHIEKLKEGFLSMVGEDGEYATRADALRDFEEVTKLDLLDWGTGSQYGDFIQAAGFDGAILRERPGKVTINDAGGFDVSGEPVYSIASYRPSVKVTRSTAAPEPAPAVKAQEPVPVDVTPDGELLYHGTDAEFDAFDLNHSKQMGKFGHWFTPDEEFAGMFGKNVKAANLDLRNPKVITGEKWNAIREAHAKDGAWFQRWKEQLIAEGHDGLHVKGETHTFNGLKGTSTHTDPDVLAAFRDDQVRLKPPSAPKPAPAFNKAQEPPVVQGTVEQARPMAEPAAPEPVPTVDTTLSTPKVEAPPPVETVAPVKPQVKPPAATGGKGKAAAPKRFVPKRTGMGNWNVYDTESGATYMIGDYRATVSEASHLNKGGEMHPAFKRDIDTMLKNHPGLTPIQTPAPTKGAPVKGKKGQRGMAIVPDLPDWRPVWSKAKKAFVDPDGYTVSPKMLNAFRAAGWRAVASEKAEAAGRQLVKGPTIKAAVAPKVKPNGGKLTTVAQTPAEPPVKPPAATTPKPASQPAVTSKTKPVDADGRPIVRMTKEENARAREALGMEPLADGDALTDLAAQQEAARLGLADRAEQIARDARREGKPLDKYETAGALQKYAELKKAADTGDPDAMFRFKEFSKDVKATGKASGQSLQARKMAVHEDDYSYATAVQKATETKGKPLTATEEADLRTKVKAVEDAKAKFAEEEARFKTELEAKDAEIARKTAELEAAKAVKAEGIKAKKERIKTGTKTYKAKLQAENADIKSRLADMGFRLNAGLDPEAAWLVGRLALNHAKMTGASLGEVVKLTMADVEGLTSEDVIRAITAKNPEKKVRSKAQKHADAIAKEARLVTQVEDAVKGLFRESTPRKPEPKRIASLRKQLAALEAEHRKPAKDAAAQARKNKAVAERKARLTKELADAEKGIFKPKGTGVKRREPAEIQAILSQLKQLRANARASTADGVKLQRKLDAITELENHLKNHTRPAKAGVKPLPAAQAALNEKASYLRRVMRAEDTLADLNEQLRTGNFKKPVKRASTVPQGSELERLQTELYERRREVREAIAEQEPQSLYDIANNVMRENMATADVSGHGRQSMDLTLRLLMSDPKTAGRVHLKALKSFFSAQTDAQIASRTVNDPMFAEFIKDGGEFTERGGGRLHGEEMYRKSVMEKIPGWGHLIKASERDYRNITNSVRFEYYKLFRATHPNATPLQRQGIANIGNVFTGRGNLGGLSGKWASRVAFAPRNKVSGWQAYGLPAKYAKDPLLRNEALKIWGGRVAFGIATMTLAKLAGAEVHPDPADSAFGDISVGPLHWNIWGRFKAPARITARLTTSRLRGEDINVRDIVGGQGVQGLAPLPSAILEVATGKNAIGQKVTLKETAISHTTPIGGGATYEGYKAMGKAGAVAIGVPNALGIDTNVYEPKKKKSSKKARSRY
jgi:colicin import membrane protein